MMGLLRIGCQMHKLKDKMSHWASDSLLDFRAEPASSLSSFHTVFVGCFALICGRLKKMLWNFICEWEISTECFCHCICAL